MTATRWWVRMAARWLARVGGVQGHLRLVFLAMTGNGIVLQTLSQYGYGSYALEFLAVSSLLLAAYTYYYTEGGVWNQVARDRMDLSKNFADPRIAIDDITIGAAVFAAVEGRPPDEQELEAITQGVRASVEENRDGIDWMEEIDGVDA